MKWQRKGEVIPQAATLYAYVTNLAMLLLSPGLTVLAHFIAPVAPSKSINAPIRKRPRWHLPLLQHRHRNSLVVGIP